MWTCIWEWLTTAFSWIIVNWYWLLTAIIIPVAIWGKKMRNVLFPLKIVVLSKLRIIDIPLLCYTSEPYLRFSVRIKIRPRNNGTVNEFFLQAKSGKDNPINIPLKIIDNPNIIETGTEYFKDRDIGPFEAVFEISKTSLPITKTAREWVERTKFTLFLKSNYFPATKIVQWERSN
jgi:hypothetical protein